MHRCMRVVSNEHWNEDVIMCLISWNAIREKFKVKFQQKANLAWTAPINFHNLKSG